MTKPCDLTATMAAVMAGAALGPLPELAKLEGAER